MSDPLRRDHDPLEWLSSSGKAWLLGNLPVYADMIRDGLHASDFEGGTAGVIRQTLCVAEESGEFVGAVRRYLGMARRSGSIDKVRLELADVIISAFVAGGGLGIDVPEAIRDKLEIIFTRGWRDESNGKDA